MPPQTPAPLPTCDQCRYDLTGIAPQLATSPHMVQCPECGTLTDISRLPRPTLGFRRLALACMVGCIVQGCGVVVFGIIGVEFTLSLFLSVALGGAASLLMIWELRVGLLRWKARSQELSARELRTLLRDFALLCALNSFVLGLIAIVVVVVVAVVARTLVG